MRIAISLFSHYQRYAGAIALLDLDQRYGTAFVVPGQVAALSAYKNDANYHGINGFHGLDFADGKLYCCQWSRILVFSVNSHWPVAQIEVDRIIRHPEFNDLHDLQVKDDKLYVSSTGAELGLVLDLNGRELERVVFDDRQEVRNWLAATRRTFDTIASTKPHPLHLNTFIRHGEHFYATILNTGMVMRGKDPLSMSPFITSLSAPHDCFLIEEENTILVTNSSTGELHGYRLTGNHPELTINIQLPAHPNGSFWTRGIAQVSPTRFLVGLSVQREAPATFLPGIALVDIAAQRVEAVYQFDIDLDAAFDCTNPPGPLAQFSPIPFVVRKTSPQEFSSTAPLGDRLRKKLKNLVRLNGSWKFRNINIYSITII